MQVNEATQQLKTNNMKLKGLLNQVGRDAWNLLLVSQYSPALYVSQLPAHHCHSTTQHSMWL